VGGEAACCHRRRLYTFKLAGAAGGGVRSCSNSGKGELEWSSSFNTDAAGVVGVLGGVVLLQPQGVSNLLACSVLDSS
jgi:hypothetical protein